MSITSAVSWLAVGLSDAYVIIQWDSATSFGNISNWTTPLPDERTITGGDFISELIPIGLISIFVFLSKKVSPADVK